jgi:hypothetical protein
MSVVETLTDNLSTEGTLDMTKVKMVSVTRLPT